MINTMLVAPMSYGVLNDAGNLGRIPNCLLKPAEVFKSKSGKFVAPDGTDDFDVAQSGDTMITGWAVVQGTTDGADGYTVPASTIPTRKEVITDINGRFLMPADAAVTEAIKGLTCDIIVASNIQKADVGESTEDVLIIYDINVALQLVEVGLNPAKMFVTGVV